MKHLRWLLLACYMVSCATTEALEEVDTEFGGDEDYLEEAESTLAEADTELGDGEAYLEEAESTLAEVDTELGNDEAYPEEAEVTLAEPLMTFVTANIGRLDKRYQKLYLAKTKIAIDKIGNKLNKVRRGPKFIGWQEIGEDDPCDNNCEIKAIQKRFNEARKWQTYQPRGQKPHQELVKVPITSKGADDGRAPPAIFASPGWDGVSPTRFITVTHYPSLNLSVLNTHFIFGAWTCRKPDTERRKRYWNQAWKALQDQVDAEHKNKHNVVVTGDLNRPRPEDRAGGCNPFWKLKDLHEDSVVVGGERLDYIFAVPAEGKRFVVRKSGSIRLGIDGHKAHWVTGRFR